MLALGMRDWSTWPDARFDKEATSREVGTVPDVSCDAFNVVKLDPDPENRVALTVPDTSRGTVGVTVPMPMLLPVI